MKRHIDILTVVMVVIYGTLTLVAVPMHHHALEYVDTPQYHSTAVNHGVECSICTFSSLSAAVYPPTASTILDLGADSPMIVEHNNTHTTVVDPTISRRGPPVILL
jgi:hypothetical protein